jgi:hypothetical protein
MRLAEFFESERGDEKVASTNMGEVAIRPLLPGPPVHAVMGMGAACTLRPLDIYQHFQLNDLSTVARSQIVETMKMRIGHWELSIHSTWDFCGCTMPLPTYANARSTLDANTSEPCEIMT